MICQVICKCLCDKCVCAFLWAVFVLLLAISGVLLGFTGALLFKNPKDQNNINASDKQEVGNAGIDTTQKSDDGGKNKSN